MRLTLELAVSLIHPWRFCVLFCFVWFRVEREEPEGMWKAVTFCFLETSEQRDFFSERGRGVRKQMSPACSCAVLVGRVAETPLCSGKDWEPVHLSASRGYLWRDAMEGRG